MNQDADIEAQKSNAVDPLIDQPVVDPSPMVTSNEGSPLDQPDFDPSNPPLRRMRTSLTSRRRAAEMQVVDTCKKYYLKQLGELFYSLGWIGYLTLCYFLPDIFNGERDPDCTMNTALANAMFGWVLCGI